MTKEELIEAACEIIGGNVNDLSVDQVQKLMTVAQHLSDLSLEEHRSFGNLCAIRTTIDAAVTAGGNDGRFSDRAADQRTVRIFACVDRSRNSGARLIATDCPIFI